MRRSLGGFHFSRSEMSLRDKFWQINWTYILLISVVCALGFLTLYSAANGDINMWASSQMARFAAGLVVMVMVSLVDLRFWMRHAYTLYVVAALLLVAVDLHGKGAMGAQRWFQLGPVKLQPSEIMKIALVLALARYFHGASLQEVGRPLFLVPPMIMVFAPAILVLKQPDLGTAMMLVMSSAVMFFLAGVRLWKFALVLAGGLGAIPVAWQFLREYQRQRVITFLNPENDPLGSGYHIMQSKIALGSGGLFGKGFMLGTQSHLNFLPEKQTDFIFTMLAEEMGMVGGLFLLGLYTLILIYGFAIGLRARSQFARLVAMGLNTTFFLYVFINIAMVMGLVPVVGVPLPLISYGGTAMLTLLFGFGLIMNVWIHRDLQIGRRGAYDGS